MKEPRSSRAGRLACLCDGVLAPEDDSGRRTSGIVPMSVGFAFAVLAQVITLGMLPLIGIKYAPQGLPTLPFAAFFIGATIASLPASFLLDGFGRRAAFALGASLGVAGGIVLAWGLMRGAFPAIMLGTFWLGIANGFGLFYRHAAAGLGASGRRNAVAILFGAGAIAGLVAPTLGAFAEGLPLTAFVGSAVLATLAHIGALALALALPARRLPLSLAPPDLAWGKLAVPTLLGATAWFVMTALMGATPIAMVGCGLAGTAVTGVIAWHVLAMYVPALLVPRLPPTISARGLAVAGFIALTLAVICFAVSQTVPFFTATMILTGIGWSLSIVAATLLLYDAGVPAALQLALHDGLLLVGAIGGAVAAGWI